MINGTYDEKIKEILTRYGTSRVYEAKASESYYYDFMVGDRKIHVRFSDHFKDDSDDKNFQIQVVKASGDTYLIKYEKMTITRSGDDFVKYLDSFLYVFPDIYRIVENAMTQVEQNCQQFLDMKTAYERLRKEFRIYKEVHDDSEVLSKELEKKNLELKNMSGKVTNLESAVRMYKDKVTALESNIPAFLLLNEIKSTYGKFIEEANQAINSVKTLRKELEDEIKKTD